METHVLSLKRGVKLRTFCRVRSSLSQCYIYFMLVGWDVKWCPVSTITTPLERKKPFHWKARVGRQGNFKILQNHRLLIVAELLPIRRKTSYFQSINVRFPNYENKSAICDT